MALCFSFVYASECLHRKHYSPATRWFLKSLEPLCIPFSCNWSHGSAAHNPNPENMAKSSSICCLEITTLSGSHQFVNVLRQFPASLRYLHHLPSARNTAEIGTGLFSLMGAGCWSSTIGETNNRELIVGISNLSSYIQCLGADER